MQLYKLTTKVMSKCFVINVFNRACLNLIHAKDFQAHTILGSLGKILQGLPSELCVAQIEVFYFADFMLENYFGDLSDSLVLQLVVAQI